jgi:hypothetical protein
MPNPKSLLLIALLSGGCAFSSGRQWQTAQTPTKPVGTAQPAHTPPPVQTSMQQQAAFEPKLYARDGTVVGENPAEPAAQRRNQKLENDESSRSTILEWYQAALEERDALQLEVRALRTELATTHDALRVSKSRSAELEARVQALDADSQARAKANMDLAGRLTTAQIRRLQAEKLLLETKLQLSRAAAQPVTDPADPAEPAAPEGGSQKP